MRKKLQLYTLTLCLGLLGFVNTAKATAYTYTAAVGGDPSVKTNWSPVLANFTTAGATYTIAKSVTLGAAWTVSGGGSVVIIASGGSLTDAGKAFAATSFSVAAGGSATLSGAGTVATTTLSGGTLTISGGATMTILNASSGTLNVSNASAKIPTLNVTGATVHVTAGATFATNITVSAGTLVFSGGAGASIKQITVSGTGSLNIGNASSLTNNLTISAGTATIAGNSNIPSSINASGGTLTISGSPTIGNINGSGSTITISGSPSISGEANITGGVLNINGEASINDIEASAGTVNFNDGGIAVISTINTGAANTTNYISPGEIVFAGTYGGVLNISSSTANINGPVIANSTLTLGGTLTLSGFELDINGTISGAGTISGDDVSIIEVGGVGSVGTLSFTPGSNLVAGLILNSGSIILGNDLLISAGGAGSDFDQSGGGSLNLGGNTLTFDVDCSVSFGTSSAAVITGSNSSSLLLNGYAINNTLYMDPTSTTTSSLSRLILNDGGTGTTLALGSALNIIDSICPTSGTIDVTGGTLTLIADQTTVGHVGRIGIVNGTNGFFTAGSITSQVYYDPTGFQTNWGLLGTAGISNATFASWDNSFYVTCPTGCDGDGSAQNNGTPFTSITTFDETTDTYPAISSGASTISPGTGYWVYIGTASPGSTSSPILITLTGAPVIGNVGPITLTNSGAGADNGYNLVANPYPSPIYWSSVYNDNIGSADIGGTIYLYSNANQDYSTLNEDGTFTDIGSYDVSSGLIPAGEAFYIFANSGTSLTFAEDQKAQGTQALGRHSSSHSVQSVGTTPFFQIDVTKDSLMSEAAISFNPNATLGQDNHDGLARPWNGILQISTSSLGTYYAINGLPGFSQNYSLPVKILSKTTAQYTISAKNLQKIPSGPCLTLHDNYGIMPDQDLRGGAFTVTINDSEIVARFVLNITVTPLAITTNAVNASCPAKNDGSITAVGNDAGPWNYTWKNASGTVVKTSLSKATADTLNNLNNGVFSVNVSTVGTCNNATQTFTVVAPASPVSAFLSSTQVNVGDNVSFTNNSTNATNYIWNFGDGDISSQQTPNYVYNNSGTYTITLKAINVNCNDTVSSTQIIQVNATTGIKQANTGDGDINLSRDAAGNYIQFDYANQTKVNITVYNVLGQAILNNAALTVVNDKIYINVVDNKNQVLYVNILNLSTNIQTTKKFVND